jgi:hypothetical protein
MATAEAMTSPTHPGWEPSLGDRVRLRGDALAWGDLRAVGTIALPPEEVRVAVPAWRALARKLATPRGLVRTYWVSFDEPQRDSDGDGPFIAGEVAERSFEPVLDAGQAPATQPGPLELVWFENATIGLRVCFRGKLRNR